MNRTDIKLFIIDVDGTMTDGGIYYDNQENELKKFCVKDAAGFFVLKYFKCKILVLTGRECFATEKRMKELKVDYLVQNIKDKEHYLIDFLIKEKISITETGYIGDDLNDLKCMKHCGFKACPADACEEIKNIADYVSPIRGGNGVIRDVVENVIGKKRWKEAIGAIY